MRSQTLLVVLAALVAGCDTIYGISHEASLGVMELPVECVIRATSMVPGVSDVEHRNEDGGRELTWGGIQDPEQLNYVLYKFKGLNGSFYFRADYKGQITFNHTYLALNRRPPQEEIDTMRPVMREIEKTVASHCPAVGGVASATEWCSGVQCRE